MAAPPPIVARPEGAEAAALGRALAAYLEYLAFMGAPGLPVVLERPAEKAEAAKRPVRFAPKERPAALAPAAPAPGTPAPGTPAVWAPMAATLAELAELTGRCLACRRRRPGASPALGRGALRPSLILVGDDPGLYEGAAADLLAGLTAKGLQLTPERFYVSSLLKCPPAPKEKPEETALARETCLPTLRRELALLKPAIILALGEGPGGGLAGRLGAPLGLLRNKSFTLGEPPGTLLRVTFSLEQMLEEPEIKLEAWKSDLLRLKSFLDKLAGDK